MDRHIDLSPSFVRPSVCPTVTNFASRATPKPLGLQSPNFIGMLLSMSCGASGYLRLSLPYNFGLIAPDLLKLYIKHDKFCVAHISEIARSRVFELHRSNIQGELW